MENIKINGRRLPPFWFLHRQAWGCNFFTLFSYLSRFWFLEGVNIRTDQIYNFSRPPPLMDTYRRVMVRLPSPPCLSVFIQYSVPVLHSCKSPSLQLTPAHVWHWGTGGVVTATLVVVFVVVVTVIVLSLEVVVDCGVVFGVAVVAVVVESVVGCGVKASCVGLMVGYWVV